MHTFYKFILIVLTFKLLFINPNAGYADETFDSWLTSFKKTAFTKGITQETIDIAFKNVKYLNDVIKYDRKQPEFFEDTITYVSKRANTLRANKAKKLLKKNENLFSTSANKASFSLSSFFALFALETLARLLTYVIVSSKNSGCFLSYLIT